ncbi:MAG: hypothetical protein VXZ82_14590 [Planctomycetota bacterium]|nr:hypothetical protein [Planctomycetota bacterium]
MSLATPVGIGFDKFFYGIATTSTKSQWLAYVVAIFAVLCAIGQPRWLLPVSVICHGREMPGREEATVS